MEEERRPNFEQPIRDNEGKSWVLLVGILAVVVGIAGCSMPSKPSTPVAPAVAEDLNTVQNSTQVVDVHSAEEFVSAIGSDRVIRLAPGEYVLTDVPDRYMDFVRWDRDIDGRMMTIRNVKNLSIVGMGEKSVRLIVRPREVFVLNFENCAGVHLTNLTLGHAPQRGLCTCGVLGATNCANLTVSKCDLFGCGTEGLTLAKVYGFRFEDSIIRDCTYGILSATGCQNLSFVRVHLRDNKEFWGLKLNDTRNVGFTDCTIDHNLVSDIALFEVTSCSNIWFKGGSIRQNSAPALTEAAGKVAFSDPVIENNSFRSKP